MPGGRSDPVRRCETRRREDDQRQTEEALAAHETRARRAVERALEWHRDLPLDFLGCGARHLGDHRHLRVRHIGEGFDGCLEICAQTEDRNDSRHEDGRDTAMH
jgi:hypothetical protein